MEELNIRFQEILSHGHFIKGDYYLICNGYRQAKQVVKIQTQFSFSHALQCTSQQDSNPNSLIIITPLREWTTLKIQALTKNQSTDFYMYIDLKKNSISIEMMEDTNIHLSNSVVAKIVSCFGIKQRNKVLYFMDIHRMKTRLKSATGNLD